MCMQAAAVGDFANDSAAGALSDWTPQILPVSLTALDPRNLSLPPNNQSPNHQAETSTDTPETPHNAPRIPCGRPARIVMVYAT
jgi:hypothetical protein